jgi:hypothetical protein
VEYETVTIQEPPVGLPFTWAFCVLTGHGTQADLIVAFKAYPPRAATVQKTLGSAVFHLKQCLNDDAQPVLILPRLAESTGFCNNSYLSLVLHASSCKRFDYLVGLQLERLQIFEEGI